MILLLRIEGAKPISFGNEAGGDVSSEEEVEVGIEDVGVGVDVETDAEADVAEEDCAAFSRSA